MFLLEKDNNPSQFVNVTSEADPVRFERDLFEDAPGPRVHWSQCEEAFSGKKKLCSVL